MGLHQKGIKYDKVGSENSEVCYVLSLKIGDSLQ